MDVSTLLALIAKGATISLFLNPLAVNLTTSVSLVAQSAAGRRGICCEIASGAVQVLTGLGRIDVGLPTKTAGIAENSSAANPCLNA